MFKFTEKAPPPVPVNFTGVPADDPRTISLTWPANAGTVHMNSRAAAKRPNEPFFMVVIVEHPLGQYVLPAGKTIAVKC
jgi:hypothetical protein